MTITTTFRVLVLAAVLLIGAAAGTEHDAAGALPPGNTVDQWNKIAEDTVVGSGTFQIEGLIYMAYESSAVYDAVVSLQGGYQPLEPAFRVSKTASPDAAVVSAAYQTLRHYFPAAYTSLDPLYAEALAAIPDGPAKVSGMQIGLVAANQVIRARSVDGLMMPIGISSSFPTLKPGPGVWRLTPPFAPAQIPWAAGVHPFILQSAAQFLPAPPPSLSSPIWVSGFNEVEAYGGANSSVRTVAQTNVAQFWSANVVRQYNGVAREHRRRPPTRPGSDGAAGGDGQRRRRRQRDRDHEREVPLPLVAPGLRDRRDGGFPRRLRPGAGLRRREPSNRRASGLAAASRDTESSRIPGGARRADGRDGRRLHRLPRQQSNQSGRPRLRSQRPSGKPERGATLQHGRRPPNRDRQRARLWGLHYRFSVVAGVPLGTKVAAYDLAHAFQPAG